jgi:hypothetical protein
MIGYNFDEVDSRPSQQASPALPQREQLVERIERILSMLPSEYLVPTTVAYVRDEFHRSGIPCHYYVDQNAMVKRINQAYPSAVTVRQAFNIAYGEYEAATMPNQVSQTLCYPDAILIGCSHA